MDENIVRCDYCGLEPGLYGCNCRTLNSEETNLVKQLIKEAEENKNG